MKICITSVGNNLDSNVDSRFGRCPFFLIVDDETNNFEAISNPGLETGGGAGIAAAQTIVEQMVDVVITGNVGPNAFDVLQSAKVKIYSGVFNMTAKQALSAFKENKLEISSQLSGSNDMGISGDLPRGGGRGRLGDRRGKNC